MSQRGIGRARAKTNLKKTSKLRLLALSPLKTIPELEKTLISVPIAETPQEKAIYEWRAKTEFPIVKVSHFSVKVTDSFTSEFHVHLESYPIQLSQLTEIPLFQVLYLLKEAMIGYERLFQKYHGFLVTSEMIVIDRMGRCRVWLNQNFASNQCTPLSVTQEEFVMSIQQLIQKAANQRKATKLFFQQLKSSTKFYSVLAFIDHYGKSKKISIPSSYRIDDRRISKNYQKRRFNGSVTMNQAPKFLVLRSSLRLGGALNSTASYGRLSAKESEAAPTEQISIKILKSEKTTADYFSKVENGLQIEDQQFLENLLDSEPVEVPLIRSHHQPIVQQDNGSFRKFSDQYPSIRCLESRVTKKSPEKKSQSPERKWTENHFISCDQEDQNELTEPQQWGRALSGLFESADELKQSIHQGRSQRRMETHRFQLLGNIGKVIQQSFIKEEMENSYQY